ncbi:MAG: hypothetical protein D6735_02315 [Acidobacteria bacterium]|nr:MAG: hypothetical protein D6735_02315 [Acidobacteriota bacterium]
MKKTALVSIVILVLLLIAVGYSLWRTNILFRRVSPEHVLVNGVESNNTKIYRSISGDYIVFLDCNENIGEIFVVYKSTGIVSMASRLKWSFELPWFVFAPDTVTGSIVVGQFQAKLSGGLIDLSPERVAFRAGETSVDIRF